MENDELLLAEKLAWAKRRLAALTEIEIKLKEMKCLAEFARDHSLTKQEIAKLDKRLKILQYDIIDLDRQTVELSSVIWEG